MLLEPPTPSHPRPNLRAIFNSNPPHSDGDDSTQQQPPSNATWQHNNNNVNMSPLNNQLLTLSPLTKSPWHNHSNNNNNQNGLVGSITREEGHVYSLAVSGDLLYTGSESKNIRVWKNLKDHAGFKSSSGLVKSIVISVSKEKIFTGHQDGKIRIWKVPKEDQSSHKRIGTMPSFKDYVKRRVRRHHDAVSSLSLDEECGLLYSASWDKTVRVWSAWDFKWLETIEAHADAVNAVVAGFEGLVFTGSADGTVKVWRREEKQQERVRHVLEGVLLEGESAVTALEVKRWCRVVYGGCSDGVVRFWERKKSGTVWKWNGGVLRGHERAVLCVGVAGRLVLSGSGDKSVHVWKREESGVHVWLCVLAGHTGPVKCVVAVEEEKGDGKCMVYTGSVDGSVKVWRVCGNAPGLRVCGSGLRLPPVMEWKKDVKWKHLGNTNKG